jgi:hypothetical protein
MARGGYAAAVPDLEPFLSDSDESVVEHTVVDAGAERTYAAIGRAEISGDRLLGLLGGLTDLAERLAGASIRPKTVDELLGPELGFVSLADEPGTAWVVGLAARYSPFDRGVERLAPEQFASFAEPGHLKAVVAFSVHPQDGGRTLLSCDVRVRATDEDTRSTLRTTWFVAGAGLRMLARRLLELIKAEAERSSSSGLPA